MKNNLYCIIFIPFVLFSSSCKKENKQATPATYQLDSISVDITDTNFFGNNFITHYSIDLNGQDSFSNYILNSNGLIFYSIPRNDSFVIRYFGDGTITIPDFPFIEDKFFQHRIRSALSASYQGYFGQDGSNRGIQNLLYNANGFLDSLNTINVSAYGSSFDYPSSWMHILRKLNYSGSILSSINQKFSYWNSNTPNDTTSGTGDITFEYPNTLSNQKELIGLDVNDFIFYHFFIAKIRPLNWYPMFNPLIGDNVNKIYQSQIARGELSFGLKSSKLLEKINLFQDVLPVLANYKFDSLHNNRIREINLMVSNFSETYYSKWIRYIFYYRE